MTIPLASANAADTPGSPVDRWAWRPKLRWFASEYLIVVLGVLTALALNAWWQRRADTAREHAYLRQLAEDMRQIERNYADERPLLERRDHASARLVRAFRESSPPPSDSVIVWIVESGRFDSPVLVLGTAQALVRTGDINLVRDDSLRARITAALDGIERYDATMQRNTERAIGYLRDLGERVDFGEARLADTTMIGVDALARTDPMSPIPAAMARTPFPLDVDRLFADRDVYNAMWGIWRRRYLMSLNRIQVQRRVTGLREALDEALALR